MSSDFKNQIVFVRDVVYDSVWRFVSHSVGNSVRNLIDSKLDEYEF